MWTYICRVIRSRFYKVCLFLFFSSIPSSCTDEDSTIGLSSLKPAWKEGNPPQKKTVTILYYIKIVEGRKCLIGVIIGGGVFTRGHTCTYSKLMQFRRKSIDCAENRTLLSRRPLCKTDLLQLRYTQNPNPTHDCKETCTTYIWR